MAILKAFVDGGGDGDSADETHLTIGGFLAYDHAWAWFEPRWQGLMEEANVPYLHMKEFGNPKSAIYGHLKAHRDKEQKFMQDIAALINYTARGSIAATVVLDEFWKFNSDHGLKLDPYAFAVYACLAQLRAYHPSDPVDVIFDRFDNSISRVGKAWNYAKTDTFEALRPDLFTPIPLQREESWRDILPLQAADMLAWEVRKFRRERAGLRPPHEIREDREAMNQFVSLWEGEQPNKPRDRLSFQAIREGMIFRPIHIVVDEYILKEALSRHPHGWGE